MRFTEMMATTEKHQHPQQHKKPCLAAVFSKGLRQETSRRLRILAKYEEAYSFFGPFRVLTARWPKKKKKERAVTRSTTSFLGFSPVLPRLH